ncbi:hypothetical protein BKA64DRAFT_692805 [Cadophora sp. MPI-SDFR-AT-0126]|nr:hypothetical protein BKA64DRAFT_692805 [Leotiomycetes sp. MPI-SDFR-AT-0126]
MPQTNANETGAFRNPALQVMDDDEQIGSDGTLMLDKGGRSKYLGPTAGSEWLKDSEMQEGLDSSENTRAPSPEIPQTSTSFQPGVLSAITSPNTFPFSAGMPKMSTRQLLSHLPPKDEAWTLAEAYYRYCAWHHDVAPKSRFEKTFDRVYALADGRHPSTRVNAQEIALVYIIIAQGTMYNIEMPPFDASADAWLHLAELALVKGDFLSNNMIPGVQTLHLMGHMQLESEKGRRSDSAWPLWGLVMSLVRAMGMHRDGTRWDLPEDVVEERRKVFWECNAADVFQAHCFSRPSAVNPEHCDTAFPSEPLNLHGDKSYFILRFELSQISSEILTMAMRVRKPPYSEVTDLDLRLAAFERSLPFSIRCRAALMAMPSRYPQAEAAIEASPEPSRSSMTISFQQTNLALNVSETIINLHRPYFAKALYEHIDDRMKSAYAASFLAVIERCAIILAIVTDIHARFPAVSIRQWNFWYHVYNSALCLGTLVLRDARNAMATFAVGQIDVAIALFSSLTQHGANTPRYRRNLQWLQKLRAKASDKIAEASAAPKLTPQRAATGRHHQGDSEEREDADDVELLGWRTRLIERVGQDRPTRSTIRLPATPTGSLTSNAPGSVSDQNHIGNQNNVESADANRPYASLPFAAPDPIDDILRDFWDPLIMQDIFAAPPDQFTSTVTWYQWICLVGGIASHS